MLSFSNNDDGFVRVFSSGKRGRAGGRPGNAPKSKDLRSIRKRGGDKKKEAKKAIEGKGRRTNKNWVANFGSENNFKKNYSRRAPDTILGI